MRAQGRAIPSRDAVSEPNVTRIARGIHSCCTSERKKHVRLKHDQTPHEKFTLPKQTPSLRNQKALSVYKGVVITDYIDVHTIDDVRVIEDKMMRKL